MRLSIEQTNNRNIYEKGEKQVKNNDKFIPTGNEYISLPMIREEDGAILSLNTLHMLHKGLISFYGTDTLPLLRPYAVVNGKPAQLTNFTWSLLNNWIPTFSASVAGYPGLEIQGTILTPVGEKAFVYHFTAASTCASYELEIGLAGSFSHALHEINESKPIDAKTIIFTSGWSNMWCIELRSAFTIMSFAPDYTEGTKSSFSVESGIPEYSVSQSAQIADDGMQSFDFFFGTGYEEVGAVTASRELIRKGYDKLLMTMTDWLYERALSNADGVLDDVMNRNLMFSLFYSSGRTLDTEDLVLVTSRSPRYYVSSAYWDRDSLLWSFPAMLLVDRALAFEALTYVFTRQIRNVGVHSRYIDGTVLEPGFELDELCAPVLALCRYMQAAGDYSLLDKEPFASGIERITNILHSKKHSQTTLYETFLQPTDDMTDHIYLTYDNVLVWKAVTELSGARQVLGQHEEADKLACWADHIQADIRENLVRLVDGEDIFVWSADLDENGQTVDFNIYDEAPGSLVLLTHYGFCEKDDPVYIATLAKIRNPKYEYSFSGYPFSELGNAHAPHPWLLSVANSMLQGEKDNALHILTHAAMDNGIVCESIDENTGECATGEAFATCAGFVAYAIHEAFKEGCVPR